MRTQSISNQNFNGRLMYGVHHNLDGSIYDLYSYMPKKLGDKFQNQIISLIAPKPYDLFVFRNKSQPDFIELAANVDYGNILGKNNTLKSAKKVLVHENMSPDIFVSAAKDAISEYELVYNKLHKKVQEKSVLKKLLNKIFGKT